MKNRLEDEYRKLMQSETPDLWDRIEAGIQNVEQKQPEKAEIKDSKIEGNGMENLKSRDGKAERKKRNHGRYALPLAACVAACICIPLLLTGIFKTGILRPMRAENQAADMAMPEIAEDSAADAEPAEKVMEDCAAGEAGVMEECAADEAGAREECAAAKDMGDGGQQYEVNTENAGQDAAGDSVYDREATATGEADCTEGTTVTTEMADLKQEKEELQKQQSICLHILQIISAQDYTKEDGKTGSLYQVRTVESGDCTVFVDSLADFSLEASMENSAESDGKCEIMVIKGTEAYDYEYVDKAE